jgi:hypothetical protein
VLHVEFYLYSLYIRTYDAVSTNIEIGTCTGIARPIKYSCNVLVVAAAAARERAGRGGNGETPEEIDISAHSLD